MVSTNDEKHQILDNLEAVRPLRAHWVRALSVTLPWAIVFGVAICFGMGLRPDLLVIGPWYAWLASGGFLLVTYAGVVFILRESTPGQRLPMSLWWVSVVLVIATRAGLAHAIHDSTPNAAPQESALALIAICSGAISGLGFTLLAAVAVLCRRGLIHTFLAVFAACAVVIGGEALWRLHCPYTDPTHFFVGHLSPIIVLALLSVGVLTLARRSSRAA